jgi:hypothetical protein
MSARPQHPHSVSPSLAAAADGTVPAFEAKFAVTAEAAAALQAWAADRLTADPHADPAGGYRVTSVYYDTPAFAVLRRAPGFDVHKHRVRRYGDEAVVHLERKSKTGGRVWKRRATVPHEVLTRPPADWGAPWFAQEVVGLGLRPVCAVTYQRMAFVGGGPTGPIRLTFDRAAVGAPTAAADPVPVADGIPLLADEVVVEFKYLAAMPALFKEAIEAARLAPTGLSKYRRCARAAGLVAEQPAGEPRG